MGEWAYRIGVLSGRTHVRKRFISVKSGNRRVRCVIATGLWHGILGESGLIQAGLLVVSPELATDYSVLN